jgi:1-deoxy-D-xylulose-5-phosphate synthase
MSRYLDKINSPADLRTIPLADLPTLAQEIRERIIEVVSRNGGHLGSNLGAVELTIALHYCYDFSADRLVWDVGHQAYTHKLLTGRRDRFDTLRQKHGISGFPSSAESVFDPFTTGHSGTSISTALGLACGDAALGRTRKIVACIGDGSIASGVAFEALNHAGQLGRDLLVVLNDNEMSIAGTVGALASYLNRVRTAESYRELKQEVHRLLDALPVFGGRMSAVIERVKDAVRRSMIDGAMFEELGFRYYGPLDGHDLAKLIATLTEIRKLSGPVLLHVLTQKGRGHPEAVGDPHRLHSTPPCDPDEDAHLERSARPSYTKVLSGALVDLGQRDDRVVAITAAMPDVTCAFAEAFPCRHYDVGICEQHALGLACGLAAAGLRPIVAIYSTFLQRAYDQVFQELCLQRANVLLAIDRAGIVGADGPTHHGVFDVAYLRHLPEMKLLAPKDGPELAAMLAFALSLDGPAAIRFPREDVPEPMPQAPIELGRAQLLREGRDIVLWAYGAMVSRCMHAADLMAAQGLSATVVNARFAKPLDADLLLRLADRPIITVEDAALCGGFGSAVVEQLNAAARDARVTRLGIPDSFVEHGPRAELLAQIGLTPQGIANCGLRIADRGGRGPCRAGSD